MAIDLSGNLTSAKRRKASGKRSGGTSPAVDPAPQILNSHLNKTPMDPEALRSMIAECAYFRAVGRGFAPGHETDDWLAAEAEIYEHLMTGQAT